MQFVQNKGVVEFCDDLRDRAENFQLLEHSQHYSNNETSQLAPELMNMNLPL